MQHVIKEANASVEEDLLASGYLGGVLSFGEGYGNVGLWRCCCCC